MYPTRQPRGQNIDLELHYFSNLLLYTLYTQMGMRRMKFNMIFTVCIIFHLYFLQTARTKQIKKRYRNEKKMLECQISNNIFFFFFSAWRNYLSFLLHIVSLFIIFYHFSLCLRRRCGRFVSMPNFNVSNFVYFCLYSLIFISRISFRYSE